MLIRLTRKKILPASPDEIKAKVKAMRDLVPPWVWEGVKEFENKIRGREIQVSLPTKDEDIKIKRFRAMYG